MLPLHKKTDKYLCYYTGLLTIAYITFQNSPKRALAFSKLGDADSRIVAVTGRLFGDTCGTRWLAGLAALYTTLHLANSMAHTGTGGDRYTNIADHRDDIGMVTQRHRLVRAANFRVTAKLAVGIA